jgi:hypothetical protein
MVCHFQQALTVSQYCQQAPTVFLCLQVPTDCQFCLQAQMVCPFRQAQMVFQHYQRVPMVFPTLEAYLGF